MRNSHLSSLPLLFIGLQAWASPVYTITKLGPVVASYAALNDTGQVIATSSLTNHATVYTANADPLDLGSLGSGLFYTLSSSYGYGINNIGQATGYSYFSSGATYNGFLYDSGKMASLGTDFSQGYSINDRGQVTGVSDSHAVVFSNGHAIDIGTLGGSQSIGISINKSGAVAGVSTISSDESNWHAFLYNGAKLTDLGLLGGSYSYSRAVNDSGSVTGRAETSAGEYQAFLYSDDSMKDLGTLTGADGYSEGLGIDNAGDVVGFSYLNGVQNAVLYRDGSIFNLNDLIDRSQGDLLELGWDINNRGQIAAIGQVELDGTLGGYELYLLTPDSRVDAPVPEPNVAFLSLTGLSFLTPCLIWKARTGGH